MGSLQDNWSVWTEGWDWSQHGDEWSRWWGGTEALWYAALLPRIHAFVPTGTILEIAPGHGRWSQYLRTLCERLVLVDLAENCIDACRKRFSNATNIDYHVNDGRSLAMVADESVDLAFSFDSLVHADLEVLEAYISQLAHKLAFEGVAFIHHSNAGAYRSASRLARRVPDRWAGELMRRGVLIDLKAWRSPSVTANEVDAICDRSGLSCVGQERISWESGYYLIDAISIITRKGSRWDRPRASFTTRSFHAEARRTAQLYARSSFPGPPFS
jgi:2-polyprenyl-3-methyl-5-hydroxy-6-metoxy-1,4-benzoquinol methylase